jgi:hypothetical protein
MKIEIELNDKAYKRLQTIAEVSEQTVNEYIKNRIDIDKLNTWTEEQFNNALESWKNTVEKRKEREILSKHKFHEYILKKHKNGDTITIAWRTCKIADTEDNRRFYGEGVGRFWYDKRWVRSGKLFSEIKKSKRHTFKTLKSLKKAINREFENYDYDPYYKVR